MHVLDGPPVIDESSGEPVEQLGMRRRRPQLAEVAGRAHEALSEVFLPDAVDHHAGGEGVLRGGYPVG